jgi:FAD synthase
MIETKKPILIQKGVVEEGLATAREVGFPTANIRFSDPEVSGTYASRVRVDDTEYRAAIYANQKRSVLEAHLLDFSGDLYGKDVTMILLERMAESKTFQGTQDEKSFIDWAVAEVEKYFNREE